MIDYSFAQCYLNSEKDKFVARNTAQYKMYELFIEALNVIKEEAVKFDGKVLRVTFERAVKERMKVKYPYFYCTLENGTLRFGFNGEERTFSMNSKFAGYLECNETDTKIICNSDGRINAVDTCVYANEHRLPYYNERIPVIKDCIENFDTYVEKAREVEKVIAAYKKEVPQMVALNIDIRRPYTL